MTEIIVEIENGKLEGKTGSDFDGNQFYQFLGIPYAEPPINNLRFKDPLPLKEKWTGVREAKSFGNQCIQQSMTFPGQPIPTTSEDCLYLNVFTRTPTPATPKPVMVAIHGGAFTMGSGDMCTPDYLLTADLVLVTINYRLGPLGFLQLPDPALHVPGNAGLKDCVLALRWIQRNIRSFGGDPASVTIAGVSAGASAVHYLTLSPLAAGLFHRAIAQSGSALNAWARGANDAPRLAAALGFGGGGGAEVLAFLRAAPADALVAAVGDTFDAAHLRAFSPGVEYAHPNAFIVEDPARIVRERGRIAVPFLTGCANREGLMLEFLKMKFSVLQMPDMEEFVPWTFNLDRTSQAYREVNEKITQFYFNASKPDREQLDAYHLLFTDTWFENDIIRSAVAHAESLANPQVFLYQISLETKLNAMRMFMPNIKSGVSHGDDIGYFFKGVLSQDTIEKGSKEEIGMRRFINMWANFAKYGNPTSVKDKFVKVDWLPVENGRVNFMDIGDELVMKVNPDKERNDFWNQLRKQHSKGDDN